jgi:hypothetical protein
MAEMSSVTKALTIMHSTLSIGERRQPDEVSERNG